MILTEDQSEELFLVEDDSGLAGVGVTNVTASLPLHSTEGTTPNLTIDKADTNTDGYLSAADWNTFNNKPSTQPTPGNPDKAVQFNDGGNFGGSANFEWDKTTDKLLLGAGSNPDAVRVSGYQQANNNGEVFQVDRAGGGKPLIKIGNFDPGVGADADKRVEIGNVQSITGSSAVAIGNGCIANGDGSVAIGVIAEATGDSAIGIGIAISHFGGIAIGGGAQNGVEGSTNTGGVAIGRAAGALVDHTVAIGASARAIVPRQIAIGKNNRINPFPPGGRTNVFDKTYPCFVIGSGDDSAKFTLVEITFDGNHRLYQTATDIPSFQGAKDRGTASTPLPPQAGDILLEVAGTGYITTATDQEQGVYYKSGAIRFVAHETFNTGPGGGGSEIAFLTTKDGATNTSLTERLRITNEGNVGLGTPTPDASSLLDITSTAAGILIPRVTTGQRDAIASPATGLLVFNTTTVTFQFWDGVAWVDVGAGVVSSSIPPFASSCNLTPGVTKYFGLSGFAATPNASPDSNATAVMPRAGTLRNMYIRCGLGVAPSMGESITVTIFKNGVSAASITATISDTATTANDLVNTVAVSAGDYIDVQFVTTGGVATAYLQMGIELV